MPAWSATPRLLLLDEPTSGLDPGSRIELWEAIRDLGQAGTDIVLTTQYLDEADHLAASIVIIDQGRVIARARRASSSPGPVPIGSNCTPESRPTWPGPC